MKTNRMADRYLNTNSNFVMLIINKQSCDVARTIRNGVVFGNFAKIGRAAGASTIDVNKCLKIHQALFEFDSESTWSHGASNL